MATSFRQSENLQMVNMLWKLIEPQNEEVKAGLRQRLNEPMGTYTLNTSQLSPNEIVEHLSGILKDIPQEAFAGDDRAQYILSK